MTSRNRLCLVILTLLIFGEARSQNSQILYFSKLPQSHMLNPAIRPVNKYYIGLPVLAGINVELGNNFLSLSDILPAGTKIDSAYFENPGFDLEKLSGKLKKHNTINTDESIQLLGIGLTFGKDLYVFFDVIDRISIKSVLPRDLLELYIAEPADFPGKTIDLTGMNIQGNIYREYGLGFSKNLTPDLRIGAKFKLLSGIGSMSMENKSFSLRVNNDLSQDITADAYMNVSGKESLNSLLVDNNIISGSDTSGKSDFKGFILDYLTMPVKNAGFGLDVGAVYNVGKMLSISAGVTDLGFIKWKKDLKSYSAKSNFSLPGISLNDVMTNPLIDVDSMVSSFTNTIKDNFRDTVASPFTTYLSAGINAGIELKVLPVLSFGILSNTRFIAGTAKEAMTLSANTYFGRTFSASLSYTMANYSYNNIGFGMSFKAGPGQVYIIADKIPLKWEKIYFEKNSGGDYFPVPIPQNMNLFSLAVGMNITFGKTAEVKKKIDKPMLMLQDELAQADSEKKQKSKKKKDK